MYRIKLIIVFLLISLDYSNAQQYYIHKFSVKDGLSGSFINCILHDSRGYTWIGVTESGLCRYDGLNFKVYSKADGLVGNNVLSIAESDNGSIWIGTTEGASVFDGTSFKNYNTRNGLNENNIYSILPIENNGVLLCSRGGGMHLLRNGNIHKISKRDGLPSDSIYCAIKTNDKEVILGLQGKGAVKYINGKFRPLIASEKFNRSTIFCGTVDNTGIIWLGTPGGQLYKVKGDSVTELILPVEFQNDFIGSLVIDDNNNLLIATNHGLLKLMNDKFVKINKASGLSSDEVLTLSKDKEGAIWIGTNNGINIFNNDPLVMFNEQNGFENAYIQTLALKNNDELLIGSNSTGLYSISGTTLKKVQTHSPIDNEIVCAIKKKSNGEFVIGTRDNGFYFTDKNLKPVKQFLKVSDNIIYQVTGIVEDIKGNIFIATYGSGLIQITKEGKLIQYITSNSNINSNNILTISLDFDNNLLVGFFEATAQKLKGVTFSRIDCVTNSIYCIDAQNGITFYGTSEKGIILQTAKNCWLLGKAEGLKSNNIQSLKYIPNENKLWVGTNKGLNIVTFDKNFKPIKIEDLSSQYFYGALEITQNSIFFPNDQIAWIGTSEGLLKFNANNLKTNNYIPEVIFNEILLNNKKTNWSALGFDIDKWSQLPQNPELKYNQNQLIFKFAASGATTFKLYQFKLEGFDNDWSPAVFSNEAIYSKVPSGKSYTFKVRLISKEGRLGKESSFNFTIKPPIYETWWFRLLSLIAIALLIYFIYKQRVKSILKEKKILEEKILERTLELNESNKKLASAFHEIKDSINYAKRIQASILPPINEIQKALKNSFVLFLPKDIVSGDFYWFYEAKDYYFISAADCTGHGVPGSLMSMVSSQMLNDAILISLEPGQVLELVNQGIKKALRQTTDEDSSRDGMDLALCRIDKDFKNITYAGANRPLLLIRNKEITEFKPTKSAIGGLTSTKQKFEQTTIKLTINDTFYLFTDGLADQFGGALENNAAEGKKLKTKNLKEKLLDINTSSMTIQKNTLETFFNAWKGHLEQTDDVLIIGIKV